MDPWQNTLDSNTQSKSAEFSIHGNSEDLCFLQVDVDQCQETAAANGVSEMPTFIFFRNKTKIDKIQGADNKALEEKVRQLEF